jgi:hypothetical protein
MVAGCAGAVGLLRIGLISEPLEAGVFYSSPLLDPEKNTGKNCEQDTANEV